VKQLPFLLLFLLGCSFLPAQEVDPLLQKVRGRMESIETFQASVEMQVDISFVNMPVKQAEISYVKGEPISVTSEDFVMIPKRGLDLTLNELFRYPFMTLNLGKVELGGRLCELIKIIPSGDASDYSIASLWVDPVVLQVLKTQISTKKNGVYDIFYAYSEREAVLPSEIRVEFEVSGVKIPLRFLGRDTQVDRDGMRQNPQERGAIYLNLAYSGLTRS
jgi:hypothetical protein